MLQLFTKPNFLIFLLTICFCSVSVLAQPPNDLCADAIELTCGTTLGNVDATTATSNGFATECVNVGVAAVWYTFEGTGDLVDIVVSNETEDLEIQFFSGTCGVLTCIDAYDNTVIDDYQTIDGTTYYFSVGRFHVTTSDAGTFDLSFTCTTPDSAPENDLCGGAIELSCGDVLTNIDASGATDNDKPLTCFPDIGNGLWYYFEGTGDAITIEWDNPTSPDLEGGIFTGTCGDLTCIASQDEPDMLSNIQTEEGTTYYIYIALYQSFVVPLGNISLSVTCSSPLENDICADAIELSCGDVLTDVDATTATKDDAPNDFQCSASTIGKGVWYYFEGNGDLLTVEVTNETKDIEVGLYTGSCGALVCQDQRDDPETITDFQTTNDTKYYIYVGYFTSGSNQNAGTFDLSITCASPGCIDPDAHNYDASADVSDGSCETCDDDIKNGDETGIDCGGSLCGPCIENDDVCDATLMELNTLTAFDFDDATVEDGEPSPGAGTSSCFSDDGWCHFETTLNNTVWFTFVAPESCVRITTSGIDGDSQIALWAVDDCGDFTTFQLEGANDDSGPGYFSSLIQTDLIPGETYYLQIDEFDENGSTAAGPDCIDCMVIVEEINCGCTNTNAHNYDETAIADDGSCETCDDGIQNGDELDIDCGGELCEPCPCYLEGTWEIGAYESGCAAGPANRVVVVTFEGGYSPVSYTSNAQGGSFISPKGAGIYQVVGYGPWSIEATDANGCIVAVESSEMPYVSSTSMTQETGVFKKDGSATVEVTGGTPPYTVEWSNDTEGTIDASGGSHTVEDLEKGNYEALVTDADGKTAKACINVSRKTSGGRSGRGSRGRKTADAVTSNSLLAQPNPFSHTTAISFNLPEEAVATLSVYSLSGKLMETIYQGETEADQDYRVELDASSWTSGVYILRLTTDKGHVEHQRLLVAK